MSRFVAFVVPFFVASGCATAPPPTAKAVAAELALNPAFIARVAEAIQTSGAQPDPSASVAKPNPVERAVAGARPGVENKPAPTAGPYAPATLQVNFRMAVEKNGLQLSWVHVDPVSPPILWGRIAGSRDAKILHRIVADMPGGPYRHAGAATLGDGKRNMVFAINVVPYPPGTERAVVDAVQRRLISLASKAEDKAHGR